MNINEFVVNLKSLSQKPIFLKCAIGVGITVMLLILVSDISNDDTARKDISSETITFESADIYADSIEKQLCRILETIEGVGKADVMLTLTSTEEYVYAERLKQGSSQSEIDYVIIDKGSKKEALLKKINNPAISGVVIVCEGGDDPKICERIYKATSTALDISTGKIYVAEMK